MYPAGSPIPRKLVAAAKAGDQEALRRLYARLRDYVSFLLLCLAGGTPGLEDLGNDICARVILHLGRYRGKGPFTSWVGMITARRFYRWRKLEDRREQTKTDLEAIGAAPPDCPDEVLDRREKLLDAAAGAKRLPKRLFECFAAVDLRGELPVEAVKTIGGTSRAIANAAYRARLLLRAEIERRDLADAARVRDTKPAQPMVGLTPATCAGSVRNERGGDDDD
ncbi:MAG: RNA polymerase sigma factor [Deltaproteobacteria bacterium]|nr:RNA polymerase sigma factor [Deltaproteobacteria bacterium]